MLDTEKKVNEQLQIAVRRMVEYAEEAGRRVSDQKNPVGTISTALGCMANGLLNSVIQTTTALSYIQDERDTLRHLLRDIIESLPRNRDWLNPDTERWAREILKIDAKDEEA